MSESEQSPRKYIFEVRPPEGWDGPPHNEQPVEVLLKRDIASNEKVVLRLKDLSVFSTGFEFEVSVRAKERETELAPFSYEHDLEAERTGAIPPAKLQLRLEFRDGSFVTNATGIEERLEQVPKAAMRATRGTASSTGKWEQRYWVWPLPPPGPLTLVCEWPEAGIPLTRLELDTEAIRAAASRSQSPF